MTPLSVYYDMLDAHDWLFEYSDDPRIWRAGRDVEKRLDMIAAESNAHRDLHQQFYAYKMHPDEQLSRKPRRPK